MKIDQMPAVLTSFAYRDEYFPELDRMVGTVREHHPAWPIVTGRGPVAGFDLPTLAVESPAGSCHWSLPVAFSLDESENDWQRIVMMKGWWMAQVWRAFGHLVTPDVRRILWLDADGRLNGPLDFDLEPGNEVFASPWWTDPGTPVNEHHVCSGLLLFQGADGGAVENIIDQWSARCITAIQGPPVPSPFGPWPEGDQDVLTKVVHEYAGSDSGCDVVKLRYEKYCGIPDYKTGAPNPEALVGQRMMNEKMRLPKDRNRDWPPPEPVGERSVR